MSNGNGKRSAITLKSSFTYSPVSEHGATPECSQCGPGSEELLNSLSVTPSGGNDRNLQMHGKQVTSEMVIFLPRRKTQNGPTLEADWSPGLAEASPVSGRLLVMIEIRDDV